MANSRRAKVLEPIAMSKIEYGALVDEKHVVKTFEAGDVVDGVPEAVMEGLMKCGAVKQLRPDAPAE